MSLIRETDTHRRHSSANGLKLCDQISDVPMDAYLDLEARARLAGTGMGNSCSPRCRLDNLPGSVSMSSMS
jgi:hypothetical protein